MQAKYAYIDPNQFTVDTDCDLIAAHYPDFEEAEYPQDALAMAQKIADLIVKPVTVDLWERDRSYLNRHELEPVTVEPDPVLVCSKALDDMDASIAGINRDLTVIAALI